MGRTFGQCNQNLKKALKGKKVKILNEEEREDIRQETYHEKKKEKNKKRRKAERESMKEADYKKSLITKKFKTDPTIKSVYTNRKKWEFEDAEVKVTVKNSGGFDNLQFAQLS